VDPELNGNGRGSDGNVLPLLEPRDLVLDNRFRSIAKLLNALRFPTHSVSRSLFILGVSVVLQIRPYGLVADELPSQPFDVDTCLFEPSGSLDVIAGTHAVVRKEPVVVRGLAVKSTHSGFSQRGTQEFPVEVICEFSQAPPVFVPRPQAFELFTE